MGKPRISYVDPARLMTAVIAVFERCAREGNRGRKARLPRSRTEPFWSFANSWRDV